jgi:hypothetical protein
MAWFSSNIFPLSSNADRAPQLKAGVRHLSFGDKNAHSSSYLIVAAPSINGLAKSPKRDTVTGVAEVLSI